MGFKKERRPILTPNSSDVDQDLRAQFAAQQTQIDANATGLTTLFVVMEDSLEFTARDAASMPEEVDVSAFGAVFAIATDILHCVWQIPEDVDKTFAPVVTLSMSFRGTESGSGPYGLRILCITSAIQDGQTVNTTTQTIDTEDTFADMTDDEPLRMTYTLDADDHLVTGSPWAIAFHFDRGGSVATTIAADPMVINVSIKYRMKVTS